MSFRHLKGSFVLFLLSSFFIQCEKEQMGDCFKGKGERIQEERAVSGYNSIILHDHIRLILEPDKEEGVSIEAGENLLPLIKSERKGNHLILRDENSCNWVRSYEGVIEAHVGLEELKRLEHRGTSEIRTNGTIRTRSFSFHQWGGMGDVELQIECDSAIFKQHTGAADLTCNGNSEWSYLYAGGNGFMHLEGFPTSEIHAVNDATGDIRVNVSEELRGSIESIGSILYKGEGELVSSRRNGKGKIERMP